MLRTLVGDLDRTVDQALEVRAQAAREAFVDQVQRHEAAADDVLASGEIVWPHRPVGGVPGVGGDGAGLDAVEQRRDLVRGDYVGGMALRVALHRRLLRVLRHRPEFL